MLNPVLAGDGVPLMRAKFDAQRYTLTGSEPLESGIIILRYRRS